MRKAPTSLALSFALALAAFGQAPELKYTLTIFVDEGHGTFDVGHVFVELSDGKNRIYRGLYPPESVEDEFGKWSAILASGGQLRDDKYHGWDVKRIYNITKEGFDIAAESILATDLGQNPERWWFNNHCGDFAEAIANFAGVPIHLAWTGSGRDRPPLFGAYLREHGGRLRRPYSVPAHPIEAGDEPSVPARPLAAERGQTGEPGQGDIIISTGHGEIVVHQAAPAAAAAAVPAAAAAAVPADTPESSNDQSSSDDTPESSNDTSSNVSRGNTGDGHSRAATTTSDQWDTGMAQQARDEQDIANKVHEVYSSSKDKSFDGNDRSRVLPKPTP
jgi:hypothetical protein